MSRNEELKKVICEECGKDFEPKRRGIKQQFCSAKCRWRVWDRNNPRVKIRPAVTR